MAMLTFLAVSIGLLEVAELHTQDVWFLFRPARATKTTIVIVGVSRETEQAWPEPMAFWGTRFADVIKQANHYGAKVIGVDYVLAAPVDTFVQQQLEAAVVPLPLNASEKERWIDHLPTTLRPDKTFVHALNQLHTPFVLADDSTTQTDMQEMLRSEESIRDNLADAHLPLTGPDGVIRNIWLYTRSSKEEGQRLRPNFAAQVASYARGLNPADESTLRSMAGLPTGHADSATFGVNYTSPVPGLAFPIIPAEKVASDDLKEKEKAYLQDAIVLVGSISNPQDMVRGIDGRKYSGVELQAQAVSTLLDKCALHRMSPFAEALWTLGLACGIAFLTTQWEWSLGRGLSVLVASGLVWSLIAFLAFVFFDRMLPVAGPLLGLSAPFLGCYVTRSVEEAQMRIEEERLRLQAEEQRLAEKERRLEAERQQLRLDRALGCNLSPAVRDHLMRHEENLNLGGMDARASVLFFDLRGSTHFAEGRDATHAFAALNAVYDHIVPLVEKHGGLVNRFLGDGFLAVFGVLPSRNDHAQAALDTAFELVRMVHTLAKPDGTLWEAGCGVHTGHLAYGNLGWAERSEFTVIGDVVNLAARLEGLNKKEKLNSAIVASETTVLEAGYAYRMCGPKEMPIPGRTAYEMVYYFALALSHPGAIDAKTTQREQYPTGEKNESEVRA